MLDEGIVFVVLLVEIKRDGLIKLERSISSESISRNISGKCHYRNTGHRLRYLHRVSKTSRIWFAINLMRKNGF